jgi:choline kinase
MKIIILAAGLGSRLAAEEGPKALVPLINGKIILEHQLDNLARYVKISDVRVVVGYQEEKIRAHFPHIAFVKNPLFRTENTSKSLLRALHDIENEDVLWLNGDVVFNHTVISKLLLNRRNSMVVNTSIVGDEEVKYRLDGVGCIVEVSKTVDDPMGEAVGINYFTATDLTLLKEALAECAPNDYFEKAIQICVDAAVDVWAVEVVPEDTVEIDFPEDLEKANRLIKTWVE